MHGFAAAAALPLDEWTAFLAHAAGVPGIEAPPLPDPELQQQFVGASGLAAMQEAARFYDGVMTSLKDDGSTGNIGPTLDFGCGWGRIYRLFLRNCRDGDLIGVDVDAGCVELCREAMPFGTFLECAPLPRLPFPSGAFRTVVAYSVFSHLAEEPMLAWMREFRRLLRPGGHVAFTTLKPEHLAVWDGLRDDPYYGPALEAAQFDRDEWERAAGQGRHLYVPTGGGGVRDASFYGEAIVSRAFLERSVVPLGFEITQFEDPPEQPQKSVGLRAL